MRFLTKLHTGSSSAAPFVADRYRALMAERNVPTVVVARQARPGAEEEFEAWLVRLHAAAHEAPGHLRSALREPSAQHPDEWTIIYQFDSVECRQQWLDSPVRRQLLHEGRDLTEGEPREQVLAMAYEPAPVTAVASFRLGPGGASRIPGFERDVRTALARFDGYLAGQIFEPVAGVQEDTVVTFTFDTRDHLDEWLASDERAELLASIEPHVEGERVINVVDDLAGSLGPSFAGWFSDAPERPVKRWKQASVVLLALFPTSLALTLVRGWLLPDLPLVPAVFASNVAGIIVLTWLLMPYLTRLLAGWLRR